MSERLAEVGRRIATVRQLDTVVNAMRGIAGARAQQGRAMLPAIRDYAETAARAISHANRRIAAFALPAPAPASGAHALIVFGAEQGFAGAFPEQVLEVAAREDDARIFLIGNRAAALAAERGLSAGWRIDLPGRATALPDMVTALVDALYDHLAAAGAMPVALVYPIWRSGHGVTVVRRSLLPLDPQAFPASASQERPITNLPPAGLLERLAQEYVFAQLCEAAAEAFAAENEARMVTMTAARTHIESKLQTLAREEGETRQVEITAEVVELAGGALARRAKAVAFSD